MSVVFTDVYTVSSDTALESYPSGSPDYSSLLNGNNLIVNAANDRVQVETSSSDVIYRCLDTACPTGDYKASIDVGVRTGYDGGYVAVRCHASTADCYALLRASSTLWELYRLDGGTFVLLTSYSVSTTDNSTQAIALKATGTNPVALTPTLAGSDRTVFNDSNANRKQSGRWGGAVYDSAANAASWFDNASIDDLAAGGTPVGMATETDTALALSRLQILATGLSSETDTSLALSAVQIRSAGNSIETDTALALSALQIRATGMATETDTAFALAAGGAIVGTAVETDSAFALAAVQITATGRADEADTAQALAPVSVRAAGMASETDSALALDRLQITATGLAAETDTAFSLQSGALPVGMAVEEDTAFALLPGSSATADGAQFPKRRKLRFYAEDEETPAEEAPKAAPVPEITPPVPQKQQVVPQEPQPVAPNAPKAVSRAVSPFAAPQPPLAPTMTPEEVETALVEAEEEAAAMRAAELLLLG